MEDPIKDGPPPARPFNEFLMEFRRGVLHDELSRELHDVIDEVSRTEKAGELRLVLRIKPVGDMQIEVTGECTSKLPKPSPAAALFYVDLHGNPSRHDPYQQRMFDTATGEEITP